MADTAHIQTISAKSRVVRQNLFDLINLKTDQYEDIFSDLQRSAAADCLDRFSLWAGNMGAMRSPRSPLSLDHRLHEAEDIREQINRQLDEILEAIVDLSSIVQQTNLRRETAVDLSISSDLASLIGLDSIDDVEDSTLDDADMLLQIVSESIKSLLRLGILVRKVSPRDRFQQALLHAESAFPEWFDINYVTQRYDKLGNSQLSNRLGSAIAKRRQFIKYCRDHRSRLGLDETSHDATASELLSSKATTFVPISDHYQHGEIVEEEYDGISLTSASTMANSSSSLKLPQLDELSKAHEPFECPICFTLRSFKSQKAWQIHAFSDLKAYVCTLGGRECDTQFFGSRDAWFEHELREHRCLYTCSLCNQGRLSLKGLQVHIANSHKSLSHIQSEMLQDAGRETPTSFKAKDCPFCDEWAESLLSKTSMKGRASDPIPDILVSQIRFKRHVATHQEQLAIFAVPRATEAEDVSDHESLTTSNSTTAAPSLYDVVPRDLDEEINVPGELDTNDNMDIDAEMENDPLQESVTPTVGVLDNNNATGAINHHALETNEEQIPRASRPEGNRAEMPAAAATRRSSGSKRKNSVYTWQCCRCGQRGHLWHIALQCFEASCQHKRCDNCIVGKDSVGPDYSYM